MFKSSQRMETYVPLIQRFVSRAFLFHATVAEQLGLHASDLKALQLLGAEPLSPGEIGEKIGLTGASVTALIDRLEHAGYVARERGSQDRRRVTIRAVPEKLREIARLYAPHYRRMSKLLAKYSEGEFRAITDYLTHASVLLAVDDRI